MTVLEIILIGIGLSMDAAAVSMTNAMAYKYIGKKKTIAMPLFFGLFQALMPLLGYFIGGIFSEFVCKFSGIIILLILGIIGAKMVKDGFEHREDADCVEKKLTYGVLFAQSIATSIDAFAVGVGFAVAGGVEIFSAVTMIGVTTFLIGLVSVFVGRRFGNLLGSKAEILGGVILIIIGIKAVLPI